MVDVVNKVETRYVVTGIDTATAALDRIAAAEAMLARQSAALAGSTSGLERTTLSAQRALDAFTRSHDPATRALAEYERGLRLSNAAAAQGVPITDNAARALAASKKTWEEAKKAVDGHTAATGLNRNQQLELMHVAKSLFDEIAAGASPMRALTVEGGRIAEIFGEGKGGVLGTLKGVGGLLLSFVSPAKIATAALVGVGKESLSALMAYEAQQTRLIESTNGLGRASGATVAQLRAAATAGAASGGLSTAQGVGLAATYTGAGLSVDLTRQLVGETRAYGRLTGQDTDKAGEQLAELFKDPERGAQSLNERFGLLDGRLKATIDDLTAQGRTDEARAALNDRLNETLRGSVDATWGFSKAIQDAKNGISNAFTSIGGFLDRQLFGGSPQEQIKRLQEQLPRTSSWAFGGNNTQNVQAEIARLQKLVDSEARSADKAREDKEKAEARETSIRTDAAVKAVLPELAQLQATTNRIALLRDALTNPRVLEDTSSSPADVRRAFGNAVVQQAANRPGVREDQDYQLRIASADAFSLGEKAIIEARRAELEVLRQTGDVAKAATASTMAWNEALAKANSDAQTRLDQARQDSGLIGLSPYARARQEVINQFDGVGGIKAKDATVDDDGEDAITKGRAAITNDLATASRRVSNALDDLPPKVETAGAKLASAIEGAANKVAAAGGGTAAGKGSPFGGLVPIDAGAGSGPAVGTVTGAQRALMAKLVAQGVSPAAAAGFVAGTTTESGINLDPTASNGTHVGVAQWDATRWGTITNGLGPGAYTQAGQFQAILAELAGRESGAGRQLAGSNTVLGGVLASDAYERPGDAEALRRRGTALARGNALLNDYQANPNAPAVADATPTTTIHPATAKKLAELVNGTGDLDDATKNQRLANVDKQFTSADPSQFGTPLGEATKALEAQKALLQVQKDTFGQSAAAIKGATEAQQLLNRYTADGITPTGNLADAIKKYGADAATVAQAQQDVQEAQQRRQGEVDGVREFTGSSLDTLFNGLARGQSFKSTISSIGQNLGSRLISAGTSSITDGLFGKRGQAGGGLFGGALGGLFNFLPAFAEGGTTPGGPVIVGEKGPEVVNLPRGSNVVPNHALSAARAPAPIINLGDTHFHATGEGAFSQGQMDFLAQQNAKVQQGAVAEIVRNLPQIQADSLQTAPG